MQPRPSLHRPSPQAKQATLPTVALVGYGNWGTTLAYALSEAGVPLREIVVRKLRPACKSAPPGTRCTLLTDAKLDADVFWICTSDAAIASAAEQLTDMLTVRSRRVKPIVFHSSGALASTELTALRRVNASVASVHPLMTFPRRADAQPMETSLIGVGFAIEGDVRACRAARKLVCALRAESFTLDAGSKPLYHAFGSFASPMLVAVLTAAVETGAAAGFTRKKAYRLMRPIVERTVLNFFTEGSMKSFSGPIARGDAATIAHHLKALRPLPALRAIYSELARFALETLPTQNREQIQQLLDDNSEPTGE